MAPGFDSEQVIELTARAVRNLRSGVRRYRLRVRGEAEQIRELVTGMIAP